MARCLFLNACLLLLLGVLPTGCKPRPGGTVPPESPPPTAISDEFLSLMTRGRNHLEQGDSTNALAVYQKAAKLAPANLDVHLNLANAHLVAGDLEASIRETQEVLGIEPNSAAAWFVRGSALLRLGEPEEAVKALQNVQRIDPGETATFFQLGKARMDLRQWDEAITAFREGLARDPNRLHTPARYLLSQALRRAGREDEANQQLLQHQASLQNESGPGATTTFERSKYTRARVPFRLEQPDPIGVAVRFVDATRAVLGGEAVRFSGPVGIIAPTRHKENSLFVADPEHGFRLLRNVGGRFETEGTPLPAPPEGRYRQVLVGDLDNDRLNEVVLLGTPESLLFKSDTNGVLNPVPTANAGGLFASGAIDGLLMDLDFTGKLELLTVHENSGIVRIHRQSTPLNFEEISTESGIPATLDNARAIVMADWNRDDHMDVIIGRTEKPPLLLEKQRGGPLIPREMTNWVAGTVLCAGDFDNDLRPDLALVSEDRITVCYNGGSRQEIPVTGTPGLRQLVAIDYDNDGWLDLWGCGAEQRAWRNLGLAGFREQTVELGLDQFDGGTANAIHFADFDLDCDPDAVLALAAGGLRYLRNDGANANRQVKVQLFGNRSNASGLGCKVEIEAGGLRLIRTVDQLPVEIGVGRHAQLDSFLVHWFNWPQGSAGQPVDCTQPILAAELTIQEGSCPYLYAWDGEQFRFVTDILGAAPLGLPVAKGVYTDSDPTELVWIGNEDNFRPRDGMFRLQITEELREILYLDEAKLVVVDHEPGTEVHSTDKLLPAGPFPPSALMTLHDEHRLRRAETLDGREVTTNLVAVDGQRVSPPRVRPPHLRGLAEPHGWILDFGPLETQRPLVLVMNGWIRFGGGMANIAASQDPSLPFPFPSLEAELATGTWQPVEVTVGAPAGKTKTILVPLEGKLPEGTLRLRLSQAFEIHWDRIALMEARARSTTTVAWIAPAEADLHFRGFSGLQDLPWDWPLTPDYERVSPNSCWTVIPGGWCTAYGNVLELIAQRDEGLALINSGDELSLGFPVSSLPPRPAGMIRDFFLYADGWDKDSDFHVAAGTRVAPLPFHGMDDQRYGREPRPAFPSDGLHKQHNTRWVEARTLKRLESARPRAQQRP
jgi:Flp pilus assembly protein TadD